METENSGATDAAGTTNASDAKLRTSGGITTFTATTIAVADMVGIGVFTSLGFQVLSIQSPFSLVMLWIVGGVVALCGALCYGELAAALPRSGGEYNFLSRIYHPSIGFMAGWLSATVGFAAPIALAAMAFGAYLKGVFPDAPSQLALALAVSWLVSLVHLSGLKMSASFHNISTIFKILLIFVFIVAALVMGEAQPISFMPEAIDLTHLSGAPFAISLVFVMYSYSGWNASTYIIGEMKDPQRSAPRSLFFATLIVMFLYVGINAVFIYTTPIDMMKGELEVALVVGKHIFGDTGGRIVGGLICFGLVSAISAMIWIGPRVTKVMGEDLTMLKYFSRETASGVPAPALILQLFIVTLLIFTQSFESILEFIQFSLTLSSFLAVLGVMVLRYRQPKLERPYLAWGYPFTPLIFLGVTGFMLVYLLIERPMESLSGLALLLTGLVIYALSTLRDGKMVLQKKDN